MTNILIEIELAFFVINSEMMNHHQLIGSQCPLVFSNHYILYFERNRTRLSNHNRLEVFFFEKPCLTIR